MAVLTQIQLEGSSTFYDINDARISATSVATATHFLATNSGVSAINPISAADLASVLGVLGATYTEGKWIETNSYSALEDVPPGLYGISNGDVITWLPNNDSLYWILLVLGNKKQRIAICIKSDNTLLYITNMFSPGTAYKAWKQIALSSLS